MCVRPPVRAPAVQAPPHTGGGAGPAAGSKTPDTPQVNNGTSRGSEKTLHNAHCTTPVRLWWSPCVDCGSGAARPVAPGLALDCTPASGRSA